MELKSDDNKICVLLEGALTDNLRIFAPFIVGGNFPRNQFILEPFSDLPKDEVSDKVDSKQNANHFNSSYKNTYSSSPLCRKTKKYLVKSAIS